MVAGAPPAAATAPNWKTVASPAKQLPESTQLAIAQPSRPVVPVRASKLAGEPVTFFSYPPVNAKTSAHALMQKASVYPPMPVPLDGFSGVEAVIIPNPRHASAPKPDHNIGLAGQRNSPFGAPVKVAALTHTGLNIVAGTMNDAAPGSLGLWTTIVHPPALAQEAKPAPQPSVAKADEPETLPAKRRRSSRAPSLLEQSARRNSARPRIRTASAVSHWNDDFWERMSQNGN